MLFLQSVGAVSASPDFLSGRILVCFQLLFLDLRVVSVTSLDVFRLCCLLCFQVSAAGGNT